ncbi:trehalose-6-phosphate phosphatase [Paramagnetospirillum caucaseum]|uniref:Trehalose 6-phosphate phosphatase n=1 Tax=Paramagnetospirillum caucaseum TaxID=1244869 RepID=M2Y918_9PROT|nr:trehalose-6-phosphate phosphatase [Paramagnetospirillum caucaseum]
MADRTNWALFMDIDGTLLDLAPTPDGVIIPKGLPQLLDSLARALGGALALVSGRSLDSIDRLFPGLWDAVGCHGTEWRLGGQTFTPQPSWSDGLVAGIEAARRRLPGVVLERKSVSLALHFRAAPEQGAAVRALAEAAVATDPRRFGLLEGKSVMEIIPAGNSKGSAIERFMRVPPYAGRRPVFAGDDVTDESGFTAVNGMGGHSIHVGDSPVSKAHFCFPDPLAMRHWLYGLNNALGGDQDHEHP